MNIKSTVVAALVVMATVVFLTGAGETKPSPAANYSLDTEHTSVYFRIMHKGLSYVYGRFNDVNGAFTVDGANSSFEFTIKTASVDTGHAKRDDHLRKPDFFNARQFPEITFKSTAVSPQGDNLDVTGDLTIHGTTRPVTVTLEKIGQNDSAIGFATEFTIKRSDFGMTNLIGPAGDEVTLLISFEGKKK